MLCFCTCKTITSAIRRFVQFEKLKGEFTKKKHPRQNISFSVLVLHISRKFSLRVSASVFRALQSFCVINNVTVVTFNIHFPLCSVKGISVLLVMWCELRPLSFYSHSALKQQGAYIQLLVKTALAASLMTHLMVDMWLY